MKEKGSVSLISETQKMMSETSLRHCLNGSLRPVSEEVQTIASKTDLKRKKIRCVRLVSEEKEKGSLA